MGDAACHLGSTCLSCGRFVGDEITKQGRCSHCGAAPDGVIDAVVSAAEVNFILYCEHWSATVEFYRDRLGFEQTYVDDWFVEFRLAPSARVSIADAARATVGSVGGAGVTLSIKVPDLETLRLRLDERGLQPGVVSRRFGAQTFDIRDPEGNRIEFWAPPSSRT